MPRPREYRLDIVDDHCVARIGSRSILIDSGSPLTLRPPRMVSEQLGRRIELLVGMDVISRRRVTIDWPNGKVIVDAPPAVGEIIPLQVHPTGIPQVEVCGQHGAALAFYDSGAKLQYCPADAVRGLRPVARARDFYIGFGEFDVDLYELEVRIGARRFRSRFGVLPSLLATLLSTLGGSGWICGTAAMRGRTIQFDIANCRLVDATVAPRRFTLPESGEPGEVRELTTGVEAWRGWRLADVDGAPKLQSLSAPDIWDGPVFTSDVLPTEERGRRHTGVHAYRTPLGMQALHYGDALVYGQVTLLGEVCVHERGYRAERARIDRLFVRACGRHVVPGEDPGYGLMLLRMVEIERNTRTHYCACTELTPDQWLSWGQLEKLAATLADTYQCDVTVDPERPRSRDCRQMRRQRYTTNRR